MLSRGRVALIFSIAVIDCMNAADVKLGRLARISITMHLKKNLGMNARWASHENVNASPLLRSTARSASAFPTAATLMSQALVVTGLQRAGGWALAMNIPPAIGPGALEISGSSAGTSFSSEPIRSRRCYRTTSIFTLATPRPTIPSRSAAE
jgi:hypothetical protein